MAYAKWKTSSPPARSRSQASSADGCGQTGPTNAVKVSPRSCTVSMRPSLVVSPVPDATPSVWHVQLTSVAHSRPDKVPAGMVPHLVEKER